MEQQQLRFLAYYLPQYHAIPENDKWWGEGFTEWTNVKKAKPLFKGHYQPIIPGELGYYNLLDVETQEAQATMATEYGIDGFIYYQYWFGNGKMLLEKPAEIMLHHKSVDLPFCFCWANETWKGIWHGVDNPGVLIEQTYNGASDYHLYFDYLTPFFQDKRYIKQDNKPVFHIYRWDDIPDKDIFIEIFTERSQALGFSGMYFVATGNVTAPSVLENEHIQGVVGLDFFKNLRYAQYFHFPEGSKWFNYERLWKKWTGHFKEMSKRTKPLVLNYEIGIKKMPVEILNEKYIPCVLPNWDNSARSGVKSLILKNATPQRFETYLEKFVAAYLKHQQNPPFFIIKSWNEWAEGNYLEPDMKYGRKWLEAVKKVKDKYSIK